MSDTAFKTHNCLQNNQKNFLNTRLSEKLVIQSDKTNNKIFNNLSKFEQKQLIKNLKIEYSLILFDYFSDRDIIDRKIEDFSKKAFSVYLPINKIVEIHLDLIDNLERNLSLEGLRTE